VGRSGFGRRLAGLQCDLLLEYFGLLRGTICRHVNNPYLGSDLE
jgi:hypothetical protein